jgi:hypothetical protein
LYTALRKKESAADICRYAFPNFKWARDCAD